MNYDAMRDELARVLCVERRDGGKPCRACLDAANRITVKRRPIRRLLIAFARAEADLDDHDAAIASALMGRSDDYSYLDALDDEA